MLTKRKQEQGVCDGAHRLDLRTWLAWLQLSADVLDQTGAFNIYRKGRDSGGPLPPDGGWDRGSLSSLASTLESCPLTGKPPPPVPKRASPAKLSEREETDRTAGEGLLERRVLVKEEREERREW